MEYFTDEAIVDLVESSFLDIHLKIVGHSCDFDIYDKESEHEDDEPLAPLARYIFDGFECFVYEYGIAAIRDRATRETKIARFD